MTDTILLKKVIDESGISITFLAEKLGISRVGFYKKLNGETEYKASEIFKLQKILHLTDKARDKIFFAENSELNSRNVKG